MSVGAQSAGTGGAEANGGAPEGTGEEQGYTGQYADQGDNAQGSGLYDLSAAPEELRPYIEGELRKIEGNVTRKFQEHAEFRDKLGHLAEIDGLADLDAEEIQGLLAFHQVANDPELFQSWLQEVGGGDTGAGQLNEDAWLEMGIENGWFDGDPSGGGEEEEGQPAGGIDVEALKQELLGEIQPDLEAFRQFQAQQAEEQSVEEAQSELTERLQELTDEHGDALDVNEVLHLAHGYVAQGHEDPLGAAAEHYLRIRGDAEGGVIDDKLEQRERVLPDGASDTSPEGYTHDSPELKNAALARFRS